MVDIIFSVVSRHVTWCLGSNCQLAHLAIPVQSQLSERRSSDWRPITSASDFSLYPIVSFIDIDL